MNGSKKEQRRRAPRIDVRSNQIAYLNFQSGNGGIALDVSTNGLGFQAVDPLKANEVLLFWLSVPGFPHMNLSGRVAWVDESRKRGGLRVVVPEPQRGAFELWQQYLQPRLEAQRLDAQQPTASPRGPEVVFAGQHEPKRFRVSRNVLIGCLLAVLCVALAGRSQLLSTAHRIGDLLSHPVRAAMPQAASASPQKTMRSTDNAPREVASQAPQARTKRTARPSHSGGPLFASAAAPPALGNLQPETEAIAAQRNASTPLASARRAPLPVAKVSAASARRMMPEEGRNSDPAPSTSEALTRPEPHAMPHPAELAASIATPNASSVVAPSHPVAEEQMSTMDHSSQAPVSPVAFQPVEYAAPSPAAPSSQTAEPLAKIEPCQLISSIQPVYPKEARKQRVEGDVKLRVVVGTDGTVRNVAPVDGPALLISAAVDATRQFHYRPALLNGKPIETIQTVDISFKLGR